MIETLPAQAGPARDAAILAAIRAGAFEVVWAMVRSSANGHSGEFRVFADVLKIDGVRISCSAQLQQQIADALGCLLPTAKLMDMMWLQRNVTLPPIPRSTVAMDSTASMIAESQAIDAALAAQGNPAGLIATLGKSWILTNLIVQPNGAPVLKATGRPAACNYGFQFSGTFQGQKFDPCASDPSNPNCRVIQGRGTAHDLAHGDYSQMTLLVSRTCVVDGVQRDLAEVLQDPVLSALASSEGPLRVVRQPGVAQEPTVVAQAPCVGAACPQLISWTPLASAGFSGTSSSSLWLAGGLLALGGVLTSIAWEQK